jgi:putative membrane protein
MKTLTTLAMAAMFASPLVASADPGHATKTTTTAAAKTTAKISDADLQVMAQLHDVDRAEIDLGRVAQLNGAMPAVKSYGKMLVTDHQSADKTLIAIAKKHGQTIPAYTPVSEADRKAAKDDKDRAAHVKTLRGSEFDQAFLAMMVESHDKVLAMLDTAIGTVSSDDLKAALESLEPTLQKHADQARDLERSTIQAMD